MVIVKWVRDLKVVGEVTWEGSSRGDDGVVGLRYRRMRRLTKYKDLIDKRV